MGLADRFKRAGGILACIAILFSSSAARSEERPYWKFPSDERALRQQLRGWINLSEEGLSEKARHAVADDRRAAAGAAENFAGLHLATGDGSYKSASLVILDVLTGETGPEPWRRITAVGSRDRANLMVRDAAFEYALRYYLSGEAGDALEVKNMLMHFAAVIPEWPLWDRQGSRRAQDDRRFHAQWDGRGIWGSWFHSDMESSYPVLRAYDLIHDTLNDSERRRIESGIFRHQKKLIDNWGMSYSNMVGSHLLGLARFGLVLPEPEYVHEVLDIYHNMVYVGFFPDGFYREVSPAYHTMPVGRMTGRIPAMLKGYSDPPGYRHPETGRRVDDIDLAQKYSLHHERWWSAWDKLTLPTRPRRTTLAVNDAGVGRPAWWTRNPPHTEARLLGTSGIAMLGAGGEETPQQLYLLFADTHGHEHSDALNIAWFARGREVFSETNYRPLPGSDSTRAWQASAAGHNTVVIDEKNQHGRHSGNRRDITQDDEMLGMLTWRHRQRAVNKGNLIVFDHGWPCVQAAEAEAENSYSPVADLYRRTLVLVDLGGGDSYLVDIFRVRGGSRHDYMLHGCLDEEYTAEWDAALRGVSETIHNYIKVHSRGRAAPPFSFSFVYGDGVRTVSRVLSPSSADGTGARGVDLNVGRAPAMRRMGSAEFAALRRQGAEEISKPGQENTFVLVHEVFGEGGSKIASAGLVPHESDDPETAALRVVLGCGREDVFISTLGGGSVRLEDGTVFIGRLGYLRKQEGVTTAARVFDGRMLVSGDRRARLENLPVLSGRVIAAMRLDAGDEGDGVVVEGLPRGAGELSGRTLFVEMNEGRDYVWSYTITGSEPAGDGTVIWVEHDPGFEIREDGGLTKMVYHPGWGFRSPAYWRIASTGLWEE